MKEEQMVLFARALSRCNLSEKDQEVLTAVAMTLSGHPDVFRACYIAFMNDEPSYHYHPMIGAPLEFFYEKEMVFTAYDGLNRLDIEFLCIIS